MKPVSWEIIEKRGWFHKGKIKFFYKNCNHCGEKYQGQGAQFCSYRCSRLAKPIIMKGNDSPMVKNPEIRIRLSEIMKGRKPSIQTIEASVKAHKGFYGKDAKNGRWLEDRSLLKDDSKDRGGQLHREWSKNVKNRDNWTCRITDVNCGGRLESHHILGWTEHPDKRYDVNNGITLCHAHHPRVRAEEKKLIPVFTEMISSNR